MITIEIFDSHLHIINRKFPLYENQGYLPQPFICEDYLESVKNLNVVGGAVVSGSFQKFDQIYLEDALKILGTKFVGVTQLPYDTSDEKIIRLNDIGVKAIRFNVMRGGSEDVSYLESFSKRVYELAGWHTELYIDSKTLLEITPIIKELPAVSIDHLGLVNEGFSNLLSLVDKGVKVKATGFGRVDLDVQSTLLSIHNVNPHALMFGTDLPSTRAKRPFQKSDIELIKSIFNEEQASKILYENSINWYFK